MGSDHPEVSAHVSDTPCARHLSLLATQAHCIATGLAQDTYKDTFQPTQSLVWRTLGAPMCR